jgi:molecular chaperone GrpE
VSPAESHEPVVVTDKRRIDPETGQVREEAAGAGPSGAPHAQAEIEELDKETAHQVAELTADLQRVQADFANYRKRALRDQQVAAERAKAAVVSELLPVLDDLDRARSHGDLESGPMKSVADKLTTAVEGLGLAAFGDEGDEFDPSLHEAVQHEGDGTKPIVGTVMRRGYRLGDHILRHALVGVVDTVDEEPDAEERAEDAGVRAEDAGVNADASAEQAAESEESAG